MKRDTERHRGAHCTKKERKIENKYRRNIESTRRMEGIKRQKVNRLH